MYEVDEQTCDPKPEQIIIFDDILTTGAHYVAMKDVLGTVFDCRITGVFVARRRFPDID